MKKTLISLVLFLGLQACTPIYPPGVPRVPVDISLYVFDPDFVEEFQRNRRRDYDLYRKESQLWEINTGKSKFRAQGLPTEIKEYLKSHIFCNDNLRDIYL